MTNLGREHVQKHLLTVPSRKQRETRGLRRPGPHETVWDLIGISGEILLLLVLFIETYSRNI